MKLCVLHVIPSFAGGGAERQLVNLASGMAARGIEFHIAYLHEGPNLSGAHGSGAHLHRLESRGNHDPRVLWRLLALIRAIKPAVVQTWLLHSDVVGGMAAKVSGVPWLLSERSSSAMYTSGIKFALRLRLGLLADAIVANSEGGLAYWRTAGYRGPGHVIRNIIQMPQPHDARSGSGESPLLIAVGRLSEEKNYLVLLDALENVFSRLPTARATILGEGPQRLLLEQRIASSATLVGRVTLPGHVINVNDWLRTADALVSLSRFEGTPNTVVEAMANACPLIVSNIPAHRELLSDDEARFVPLDSTDAIADAIFVQLSEPGTGLEQSIRARDRVSNWSEERITNQYVNLYRELAEGRRACASW